MGLLLGAACLLAVGPALAQSVEDFYRGRTVTIDVGFGPGGGYDRHARTLARHLGRHIPGNPSIVVRNVPGAAGLVLANQLFHSAPKDGTEFGTFNRTVPLDPLLDNPQARYDPRKFTWLGSTSHEISTCVAWHTARATSIEALKHNDLLIAGTSPNADAVMWPKVLNAVIGTRFKIIPGFKDSAESLLAMERGEVEGFCAWGWITQMSERPDWVRDRKVIPLVQFGSAKHPDHPDTPLATDLARTDEERQAIELVTAPLLFARPFVAPPDLPPERAAALRKAFEDTARDPAFLDDMIKQQLEPELVTHGEIERLLDRLYATPKTVVGKVKAAVE
jgi:tripartite-type tricarboxylate transporter receptor subunit TctC